MELKLLSMLGNMQEKERSNRTFMELKYLTEGYVYTIPVVLIAPLWN